MLPEGARSTTMALARAPLAVVRSEPSTVERSADGSVTIHQTLYQAAPDELVRFPFGLEEAAAAKSLVRSGRLRAVRLGRRLYARRSDVLALVDAAASSAPSSHGPADTYEDLVARSRRKA